MNRVSGRLVRILVPLALVLAPGTAAALAVQRGDLEKKAFEDPEAGYRLRTPRGWAVVPVAPDARADGLAFQAEPAEWNKPIGGCFRVVLLEKDAELAEWVLQVAMIASRKPVTSADLKLELDESIAIGALQVRHRRHEFEGNWIDTWLFPHAPRQVGLVASVSDADKSSKSWLMAFERAAKSFETMDIVERARGAGSTYAEKLAAARAEAERTPGWRVVATPSQKFILTTSCDNQKFVDEVIDRLERARKVFEEDYPPPADFTHVSIVRVCAKEEEFHRYGGTGRGVMGWFNPSSTELVLYDAKDIDRNMSYAVMVHEGFHQYCHFLFGRSEAHRWFDEGHGDYYGGMKFEGQKPKITARMPGGLERLSEIREMIQLGTAKPLTEHLNYDHGDWQNQGPSPVSGYAQSWSIVYMLRQGMVGNVNSKVWRKEYAQILPRYIATLRKGFDDAYREEREKRAKEAGGQEPGGQTSAAVLELDSDDLGEEVVKRIWKQAMDSAWGDIDMPQFEENWKLYVKKFLKD